MTSVVETTRQIPSLSFILSTPPEVSIDEDDSYQDEDERTINTNAQGNSKFNSARSKINGMQDENLVQVANEFVKDVITKAKEEAHKTSSLTVLDEAAMPRELDPKVLEMVRDFVSEVLTKAIEEAVHNLDTCNAESIYINDNIYDKPKESNEDPQKTTKRSRRGPWYARAIRFFSSIFGRVCPCRNSADT